MEWKNKNQQLSNHRKTKQKKRKKMSLKKENHELNSTISKRKNKTKPKMGGDFHGDKGEGHEWNGTCYLFCFLNALRAPLPLLFRVYVSHLIFFFFSFLLLFCRSSRRDDHHVQILTSFVFAFFWRVGDSPPFAAALMVHRCRGIV